MKRIKHSRAARAMFAAVGAAMWVVFVLRVGFDVGMHRLWAYPAAMSAALIYIAWPRLDGDPAAAEPRSETFDR
jgi:hypothetical protein